MEEGRQVGRRDTCSEPGRYCLEAWRLRLSARGPPGAQPDDQNRTKGEDHVANPRRECRATHYRGLNEGVPRICQRRACCKRQAMSRIPTASPRPGEDGS